MPVERDVHRGAEDQHTPLNQEEPHDITFSIREACAGRRFDRRTRRGTAGPKTVVPKTVVPLPRPGERHDENQSDGR
ncbi:hypothetical protein KAREA_30780 [Prescottella equi]|nr:hypothetical protein KAREA_30780 [Prescottella equi]